MTEFFARLKQRKLVQWALAYIAASFALIQVIDVVADSYDWPHFVMHLVFGVLVLGFVVMLVLAWYHGERGAQRISGPELLLIALALAIGGGLLWHFGRAGSSAGPAKVATTARAGASAIATRSPDGAQRNPGNTIPDSAAKAASSGLRGGVAAQPIAAKSIAVLPLVNESGIPADQYFSDGLSEELISDLTRIDALKVIGRNSSFRFRDSKDDSAVIGTKLGVATLLEGTVRRQGDRVHIVLDLVKAADGSSVWSQTYDRRFKDIFALQEQIAQAVAAALKVKLLDAPTVNSDRPPSGNLDAYNAFLQGNFYKERVSGAGYQAAIGYYKQAVQIDPRYARAYAALSWTWSSYAALSLDGVQAQQAYAHARSAADTALTLDAGLAAAHRARGQLLAWADFDQMGALAECRRALQLAPNDPAMKAGLSMQLANLGQLDEAVTWMRRALATDPLHAHWYYYVASYLSALGRLDDAQRAIDKAIALQPTSTTLQSERVEIEIQRGDAKAALASAQQMTPGTWRDISVAWALQVGKDRAAADAALQVAIDKDAVIGAYQIAEVYALRNDPGNMFKWLDRAWENRDPGIAALLWDPLILRYKDDPRFAAFCRKVGLPLPGEKLPKASTTVPAATRRDASDAERQVGGSPAGRRDPHAVNRTTGVPLRRRAAFTLDAARAARGPWA